MAPSMEPVVKDDDGGTPDRTDAIVGGVVGGIFGISAVGAFLFKCHQKRQQQQNGSAPEKVVVLQPIIVNANEVPSEIQIGGENLVVNSGNQELV